MKKIALFLCSVLIFCMITSLVGCQKEDSSRDKNEDTSKIEKPSFVDLAVNSLPNAFSQLLPGETVSYPINAAINQAEAWLVAILPERDVISLEWTGSWTSMDDASNVYLYTEGPVAAGESINVCNSMTINPMMTEQDVLAINNDLSPRFLALDASQLPNLDDVKEAWKTFFDKEDNLPYVTPKIATDVMDLVAGNVCLLGSDDAQWEPGYSKSFEFTLSNAGNVKLKYELSITNLQYGENSGSPLDVSTIPSNLSEVLNVYIGSDYTDMTSENYLGTLADLFEQGSLGTADKVSGILEPNGGTADIKLSVKMQETAGNEYQGDWCTFDIVAKATKYTYEEDVFGSNQYDAAATFGVPVATKAELAAVLGAGKDVTVTEPITIDEPITVTGDVAVNLEADLDASMLVGRPFDMEDGASLTINANGKDVKVGNYGLVNIAGAADVTINGGNFTANTDNGAFIKVRDTATDVNVVLNNVTYTDTAAKGFVMNANGYAGDAKITVNGGTFTANAGFVVSGDISVKDAVINTRGIGFEIFGADTDAIIDNVTVNVNPGVVVGTAPAACVAATHGAYAKVINSDLNGAGDTIALAVFTTGGDIEAANNVVNAGDDYEIMTAGSTITIDGKVYEG